MKRIFAGLLCAALLCLPLGCKQVETPKEPYIEKATLSESEQQIVKLVGSTSHTPLFSYQAGAEAQSVTVETYALEQGKWVPVSGSSLMLDEASGRIGVSFEHLANGRRLAIEGTSAKKFSADTYTPSDPPNLDGVSTLTSFLEERKLVAYGEEIPLVMQISAKGDNVMLQADQDTFLHPEQITEQGADFAYALTIRFNREPVGQPEEAQTQTT